MAKTETTLLERVQQIIEAQGYPGDADRTASLTDDLGMHSIDIVELVMAIEEAFSIEISDDDADSFKTVGDLVEYLEKQKVKV